MASVTNEPTTDGRTPDASQTTKTLAKGHQTYIIPPIWSHNAKHEIVFDVTLLVR